MLDATEAFSTWEECHAFERGHAAGYLQKREGIALDQFKLPDYLTHEERLGCLDEHPYYMAGFVQGVEDADCRLRFYVVRLAIALLTRWRRP